MELGQQSARTLEMTERCEVRQETGRGDARVDTRQRNFSSMAQDIRLDQAKRTFCVDLSPETLERAAAEDDECPLQAGSVSRGP